MHEWPDSISLPFKPLAVAISHSTLLIGGDGHLVAYPTPTLCKTITNHHHVTAISVLSGDCFVFACARTSHFYRVQHQNIEQVAIRTMFHWCWSVVQNMGSFYFIDSKKVGVFKLTGQKREELVGRPAVKAPWGLCKFQQTRLLVADKGKRQVLECVGDGQVQVFYEDADIVPLSMYVHQNYVFVTDLKSGLLRLEDFQGIVTGERVMVDGDLLELSSPVSVCGSGRVLWVAEWEACKVRKIKV